MSARTAYRIFNNEIKPLAVHLQTMLGDQVSSSAKVKPERKTLSDSSIRISKEDLEMFSNQVMGDYAQLAQSYYLNADVAPSIRCFGGELVLRIPLRRDE